MKKLLVKMSNFHMIMSNEFLSKSAFYSSSLSFHSELSLSLMSLNFFSSNSSVNSLIVYKLAGFFLSKKGFVK